MKLNHIIAVTLLAVSTSSHALAEQPEKCPSVDLIKTITVEEKDVKYFMAGFVTDSIYSKFDTNNNWMFYVTAFAKDLTEATQKINKGLTMPVFNKGPYLNGANMWVCRYYAALSEEVIMQAALV